MFRILTALLLSLAVVSSASAQSTANNGTIEGTVKDEQGALLPGVTVTITNISMGSQRVVVTNEKGLYRAPLLSLGTYRVAAELQGFKKFEQTGIILSVGEAAVVNMALAVGTVVDARMLRGGQQLFLFSPRLLVFALVFSLALGALAASYATLRIARLSPADAIRRGS